MRQFILILFFAFSIGALAATEPLDRVIAVVNDDVITANEFEKQMDVLRNQLLAKKVQTPPEEALRKQVLQHLIDVNLQLQLAKIHNLVVDNQALDEALNKIASMNKISLAQLREALEKEGFDWETYRENVRKEVLMTRVQQKAITKDLEVTPQQVEDYLKSAAKTKTSQQTYHLQNIVIPLPEEPTSAQVKHAEQKANALLEKIRQGEDFAQLAIAESSGEYALEGGDLGERHLAELPEVFANKVLTMKAGEVAGPIRTGNGFQLIKLAGTRGGEEHHYVTKTHVRHILLKPGSNLTPTEAKRQADNLYQQLKSGKDFATMAKQYSLDAASAIHGGDLGWMTSDELVPAFAEKMDKLPLHVVSKPVKTPFGWHLIEVLERKTVDDSKAYQRQQVRQFLHQRKFTEAVQNWLQHLRADAYIKVLDKDLA